MFQHRAIGAQQFKGYVSGLRFSSIRVAEGSAFCIAPEVPHTEIYGVQAYCRMVIVCGIGRFPQLHHQRRLFARTAWQEKCNVPYYSFSGQARHEYYASGLPYLAE